MIAGAAIASGPLAGVLADYGVAGLVLLACGAVAAIALTLWLIWRGIRRIWK